MMFLLSKQKDTALLLEADNKAELIQQLRLHPEAVVILDYTLFDFTGADELIVLHERFKTADWLLFSDEHGVRSSVEGQFQRRDTHRTAMRITQGTFHMQPRQQLITIGK